MKSKYPIMLTVIINIICCVMVCFYLISIDKVGEIYVSKAQETIYSIKKDFLKDTVNNLILEIDIRREAKAKFIDKFVIRTTNMMNLNMDYEDEEFQTFFADFFTDNPDYSFMTVLLWDNVENKALFDSQNIAKSDWKSTFYEVKDSLSAYRIIDRGTQTVFLGVSKEYVEESVKSEIKDIVKNASFDGDSYIWINEIIDYNGGDNYAIRRVHPNLPETEGDYLSTDIQDGKGNFPYLTELEGIKKEGELFFTYYFKKISSQEVSEKLTYAKLYEDYDWVIAMGVYMDNLQPYFDQIDKESSALVSRLAILLVFIFIIILILSLFSISLFEKHYYKKSKRLLETQINQDTLTKADSRRSGTRDLTKAFKKFEMNKMNAAVVICDIDDFKGINDKYGHAVGDMVLVEFVKEVKYLLKDTGRLIRWGGDEFIILLYEYEKERVANLCERILLCTDSIRIKLEEEQVGITISMGVSCFKDVDSDFNDTIKRADEALYIAKTMGKNQMHMI